MKYIVKWCCKTHIVKQCKLVSSGFNFFSLKYLRIYKTGFKIWNIIKNLKLDLVIQYKASTTPIRFTIGIYMYFFHDIAILEKLISDFPTDFLGSSHTRGDLSLDDLLG